MQGVSTEMDKVTVAIKNESDIVAARQAGRQMLRELGFSSVDQTRLATAISELTRNVIKYAGEGECRIIDESNPVMIQVKIVVEDHGSGIPDIDEAMTVGFSTGNSMGAGLPGTQRLVHDFYIESEPGHTEVTVLMMKLRG